MPDRDRTSTDDVSSAAAEWFDDRCSPWRREELLKSMAEAAPWARWIRGAGIVRIVDFDPFLRTLTTAASSDHLDLFRGCVPGNEAGASWTTEPVVAAAYAKVRGGRVIRASAPISTVMGLIISSFVRAPITTEVLLSETPDWRES